MPNRKDPRGGLRPDSGSVAESTNPHRFDNLPKDKLRELQQKGREKGWESRRRKKNMKEALEIILDIAMKPGPVQNLADLDFEDAESLQKANLTLQDQMLLVTSLKAATGNTRAFELIRDTVGDKPVERQETMDVTPVIIEGEKELED